MQTNEGIEHVVGAVEFAQVADELGGHVVAESIEARDVFDPL